MAHTRVMPAVGLAHHLSWPGGGIRLRQIGSQRLTSRLKVPRQYYMGQSYSTVRKQFMPLLLSAKPAGAYSHPSTNCRCRGMNHLAGTRAVTTLANSTLKQAADQAGLQDRWTMLSSFMLTAALYIAEVASARPQALHDGITTVCKSYNIHPNLALNVHSATNASATLSCASTSPS